MQEGTSTVVFIDYLQKVGCGGDDQLDPAVRTLRVAEALKEMALTHHVAVVAVVASDTRGLTARRLRLHHLRGADALAYEADVVISLNEKVDVVSRVHLAYDALLAEASRSWVVFAVDKHRSGPTGTTVEFRKDFGNGRFHPRGRWVAQLLVDERVVVD